MIFVDQRCCASSRQLLEIGTCAVGASAGTSLFGAGTSHGIDSERKSLPFGSQVSVFFGTCASTRRCLQFQLWCRSGTLYFKKFRRSFCAKNDSCKLTVQTFGGSSGGGMFGAQSSGATFGSASSGGGAFIF